MKLADNWRRLWRAWSMWALALGAALPELLDALAANVDGVPVVNDGYKSGIRLAAILAAMMLRVVKQPAVSGPPAEAVDRVEYADGAVTYGDARHSGTVISATRQRPKP